MDISRLKQMISQLCKERRKLEDIILSGRDPLLKGSIVTAYLKCARSGCRCRRDKKARHGPYLYLHYTQAGKQKMVYLRPGLKVQASEWTFNYQRFRGSRAQIVKLNTRILRLIDQLEKIMTKELKANEQKTKKSKRKKG